MLERASTCLDPAAQYLLRRLEGPARSRRVLGHEFWRNKGEDIDVPPWWPAYLSKLRNASQARYPTLLPHGVRDSILRPVPSRSLPAVDGAPKPFSPPSYAATVGRDFSSTSIVAQQTAPVPDTAKSTRQPRWSEFLEEKSNRTEFIHGRGKQNHDGTQIEWDIPDSKWPFVKSSEAEPQQREEDDPEPGLVKNWTSLERLNQLLEKGNIDDGREAWGLFVAQAPSPSLTRRIVRYLCSSKLRTDLEHAITAYNSIAKNERSNFTYAAAVRAATALRLHSKANEINSEAVQRRLGQDSSRYLLSYYVKYQLWRSAAKAWATLETIEASERKAERKARKIQSSVSPDQWKVARQTSYWSEVDDMVSLPAKLISLGRRLGERDPVLMFEEQQLRKFAYRLLNRVIRSPKIMGVITPNGLITLFGAYRDLGFDTSNLYFKALHTLHGLRESRNRVQLAVLIYRNLRFVSPHSSFPRWVYGAMISMCCDAKYPSNTYDILLEEFAGAHGKPDLLAYQKSMTACAQQGDVRAVQNLFERLCQHHGKPKDLAFLTPLLYAHAVVGDVDGTQREFNRLDTEFDLKPNVYCWNILIYAHSRAKDVGKAFQVFRNMTRQGVKPNDRTIGTLMGLASNLGDTQAVLRLVDIARELQIPGTSAMLDTLVHSYCLNDEVESAQSLAEAATTMNIKGSTTRMWNTLLRHHAFQADSASLLKTQQRMRELAVKPDSMTYAALMSALVLIGRTKDAMQILRTLHFSQNLTADLFHYSIVLHGFAQENNRDMAALIYHEILERFPKTTASARLAMLHIQSKRDRAIALQQEIEVGQMSRKEREKWRKSSESQAPMYAVNFLSDALLEISTADLALKQPQPGFKRRSAREALPSIYMEFLITTMTANSNSVSSFHKAEALLERYKALIEASFLNKDEQAQMSIQLLTAHLLGRTRNGQWDMVDKIWSNIFTLAIAQGQPVSEDIDPKVVSLAPSPTGIGVLNQPFKSMVASEVYDKPQSSPVLPAHRYILSIPLTRYMQALDTQVRLQDVIDVVKTVEEKGFTLTSKNWNSYIQILAKSSAPKIQLLAFQLFEEKLLPNAPDWRLLRRGKWIERSSSTELVETPEAQDSDNAVEVNGSEQDLSPPQPISRRLTEKTHPGQLVPSYTTTVFLAAALMKFYSRQASDEEHIMDILRQKAPGTMVLVGKIPYLRDRIQGVLLRGRRLKGDLVKRPRRAEDPDRAGLLGSKSPLDHIPPEYLNEIANNVPDSKARAPPPNFNSASQQSKLEKAERYTGQVLRSNAVMDRTGRDEDELHKSRRIAKEVDKKLAVLKQIQIDAKKEYIVTAAYQGEPHPDTLSLRPTENLYTLQRRKEIPIETSALCSPPQSHIEDMAAEQRRDASATINIAAEAIQAQARKIAPFTISSTVPDVEAASKAVRLSRKLASQRFRSRRLALPSHISESSEYWKLKQRRIGLGDMTWKERLKELGKGPKMAVLRQLHQFQPGPLPWARTRRQQSSFPRNKAARRRKKLYKADRLREQNQLKKLKSTGKWQARDRMDEARREERRTEQEALWAPSAGDVETTAMQELEGSNGGTSEDVNKNLKVLGMGTQFRA